MRCFEPEYAYSHNMIMIRMLKKYGKPIFKPLALISHSYIKHGKFPNE